MIPVGNFVQKNFQTTQPYVGVNLIREKLISHYAIVVLEEDTHNYLGVLTPLDIAKRQCNLVVDCLTSKPMLQFEQNIEDALAIMYKQNTNVLPLENNKKFEGLIFKHDLVTFLALQNTKQGKQLKQNDVKIKKSEKVLTAIYNSTRSVRFLVDPNYKILFFNKTAYENIILVYQKKPKNGESIFNYLKNILNITDSDFKNDLGRALQGEYVLRENEIQHLDSLLWFHTEYYPVYMDTKLIGVSISARDITAKKQNEIFTLKQNAILKDIVFFQSHQVRRPVANILGIINCFDKSNLSEVNKELIELLDTTTQELDAIIKTIVTSAYYNNKERGEHDTNK